MMALDPHTTLPLEVRDGFGRQHRGAPRELVEVQQLRGGLELEQQVSRCCRSTIGIELSCSTIFTIVFSTLLLSASS
jgi:hypothetical protein